MTSKHAKTQTKRLNRRKRMGRKRKNQNLTYGITISYKNLFKDHKNTQL